MPELPFRKSKIDKLEKIFDVENYADNADKYLKYNATGTEPELVDLAEDTQDIVGGMVSGNTEIAIDVTYDDPNNKIDFAVKYDNVGIAVNGSNQLEIKDDGVTASKINSDVAGDGLGQDTLGALFINVDDSTIEISGDTLQVKGDYAHTHSNKANLDEINQDLATSDDVGFNSLNLNDNKKVNLGTDQDVSIYYDGIFLVIDSSNVDPTNIIINCGSGKTVELAQSVFEDLQFQITQGKQPSSSAPTWAALTTNTGEYGFGVNEYLDLASNEVMHKWKEGTSGNFHIHTSIPTANSSGGSYYAQFTCYIAYINSSHIWTETSLTSEIEIPDGSSALQNFYLDLGDLDLSGLLIGTQIKVRIKRIAATGGTEYPSDVFIHQIGCHLECNTLGSRTEGAK